MEKYRKCKQYFEEMKAMQAFFVCAQNIILNVFLIDT